MNENLKGLSMSELKRLEEVNRVGVRLANANVLEIEKQRASAVQEWDAKLSGAQRVLCEYIEEEFALVGAEVHLLAKLEGSA